MTIHYKLQKWGSAQVFGKFWALSEEGFAARKHFGEYARTAGEGEEEDIVGKILELSNMIVKY